MRQLHNEHVATLRRNCEITLTNNRQKNQNYRHRSACTLYAYVCLLVWVVFFKYYAAFEATTVVVVVVVVTVSYGCCWLLLLMTILSDTLKTLYTCRILLGRLILVFHTAHRIHTVIIQFGTVRCCFFVFNAHKKSKYVLDCTDERTSFFPVRSQCSMRSK